MTDILYYIFLYPFEQLFTIILGFALQISSPGIALIILSIIINIIYTPISIVAKKIEDKERAKQQLVDKEVKEIKKNYKGEAAFRKIEQVYKKYNYSLFLSFRANLSLLIMIPFFIAAVVTIDTNPVFQNVSFLGVKDLGKPDNLLLGINILPIIMTIVNIISIKISNINEPVFTKNNIKLIILALLFLVFLYNKSSALLVYWTCNNIIFLLKSIIKNKIPLLRKYI